MPNHVTNFISIEGDCDDIEVCLQNYGTEGIDQWDEPCFSFPDLTKIIPVPDSVGEAEPGFMTTEERDWRQQNWGTKWNTYNHVEHGDCCFEFQTAWGSPEKAIIALSKLNPKLTFSVTYADEDVGNNVGKYTYRNGQLLYHYAPVDGSKEAYALAIGILGLEEDYLYCEETDNYVLVENLEDYDY